MKFSLLLNNIKRNIIPYLCAALVFPIGVSMAVNRIVETPQEEQFVFFVSGNSVNTENLNNLFKETLANYGIKKFKIHNYNNDNQYNFYQNLEGYGITFSDLLILPEDAVDEDSLNNYAGKFKIFYEGSENKNDDNYTYAYSLIKQGGENAYKDLFSVNVDTNYYLTIRNNSVHYSNYLNNENSLLNDIINLIINYGK